MHRQLRNRRGRRHDRSQTYESDELDDALVGLARHASQSARMILYIRFEASFNQPAGRCSRSRNTASIFFVEPRWTFAVSAPIACSMAV